MTEHNEQVALFDWKLYQQNQTPELRLLFAIPNGGHRHKATAAKMRAEGVQAGIPDICLPVPRNGYSGFFGEMKHGRNTTTEQQKQWIKDLRDQGYCVVVAYGFEAMRDAIMGYLEERV